MPEYVVQPGDCISQLAQQFGLSTDTLWNHPSNAALKQKRKDPNVLLPGDVVFVPDIRLREKSCSTDALHKFVRKGVPAKLRLQLKDGDNPRAGESYALVVDGKLIFGTTDQNGWIEQVIPPDARAGELRLKDGHEVYKLKLGHLDPVDQISGVQARLKALGYSDAPVDNQLNDLWRQSLKSYQRDRGLQQTGEMDGPTSAALKRDYGS